MKADLKTLVEAVSRVVDLAVTVDQKDIAAEIKFLRTEHSIKTDAVDDLGADISLNKINQLLHLDGFIKAKNRLQKNVAQRQQLQEYER